MKEKKKRGRPRKVYPFFADPEAEQQRVEEYRAAGRDPYPRFKHEPCTAERDLREDIGPYVPFDLVLALNDAGPDDGPPPPNPKAEAAYDTAMAKRRENGEAGGTRNQGYRANKAQEIVLRYSDYIFDKRAAGWSKAKVIANLPKHIKKETGDRPTLPCRSEMYRAMKEAENVR